jgi:hypothetical protein
MTFQNTQKRKPQGRRETLRPKGLAGVMGTARVKPAVSTKKRGQRQLKDPNDEKGGAFHPSARARSGSRRSLK